MRKAAKHSQNVMQQELLRPCDESDKILRALEIMSTRLHRPLAENWIQQFLLDVNSYPVPAVEYVLDCWGRNGKTLPVFAEIQNLLNSWAATNVVVTFCGNCDTGWVRGFKDHAGNDAVKRCECVSR